MYIRFLSLSLLLTTVTSAISAERFQMNFELTQNGKILKWGRTIVTTKPHTLSKGLKSSYLKLSCRTQESGKIQKSLASVDLFAGMHIAHQIIGDKVELKVIKITVQPRLKEIRALTKNDCKDMSPIITSTTHSYSLPSEKGINESRAFGEGMIFRASLR